MKSARFSRWPNSARFAANAKLFFTQTRFSGLAKNRLKVSGSSKRIWFPFARTSFTGRRVQGCFTLSRHYIPIRFFLAADMKMNGVLERKILRESLDWLL